MEKLPKLPKKYLKTPQKRKIVLAFQKTLISPNKSIEQIKREVGYAPTTKLTQTKTWLELVDRYVADKKPLKAINDAFKATKIVTSNTGPDIEVKDHAIRLKAAELGLKLKGRLQDQPTIQSNVLVLPPELIKKYEKD